MRDAASHPDRHFMSVPNSATAERLLSSWVLMGGDCRRVRTGDVESLYTNLDHELIKQGIRYMYTRYQFRFGPQHQVSLHRTRVLDALSELLANLYCTWEGRYYKQVRGIPMGASSSPVVSDLALTAREIPVWQQWERDFIAGREEHRPLLLRYLDDVMIEDSLSRIMPLFFNIDS
jgi:hypothetical protein